uniref:CCR4-NOT transcription complex subunit 3 n=1 Tax=Attheya septentrionalis TaxID=420275 RepID=A0A7S2U5I8_9STRA|mmetsp:Transcript_11390/g.20809  ORF Transcript_11390/g.20809 Transcript_11390/m.20809 type:complete len:681 (+) Transcript_11390:86-2128(+)
MSNARKLQTEIDRVMKKVDEGVELFDDIWEKVYSAEQQNQKEKYEMDLKKEIKKLQRLRDQIKTWIGSSDVKDKDSLIDARKLIETKMEQFKVCEKETKTKTYSKEGLMRQEKLDPAEEAKLVTTSWIAEFLEKLSVLIEDREVEIERLQAGKGKRTNKHIIEEYQEYVANHKYHVSKLEGIMRLVTNDVLEAELVDDIKDDLDYYMEAYHDDEFQMGYDEEMFYDSLGLDDLDVVNVDRLAQPAQATKDKSVNADEASATSSKSKKKEKKNASSGIIPLNIGRALRSTTSSLADKEKLSTPASTPTKTGRAVSSGNASSTNNLGPTPTPRPPPPVPSGASMAAILKREGEQQEKERQKLLQAQQQQLREQQARAQQAEQLRQQQLRQQQEAQVRQQQEALRQQQVQQQQQLAQQEALKRQQAQQQLQDQQRQQQEAAKKQQLQLQAQKQAAAQQQAAQQQQQQQQIQQQQQQQQRSQQVQGHGGQQGAIDSLLNGLGGLSLGNQENVASGDTPSNLGAAVSPQTQGNISSGQFDASSSYLGALNDSFMHMPSNADSERQRTYTPRNPYPTPAAYPSTPSPLFDNPAIFEKLGTDGLFFIFYYAQGTYQQYLAARELKKQSWRYHKKYMTWFQRHEEPKVTTDEYEQGTYVYFDYETGWCQRIKSDFRFEYSFLEDSLSS